MSNAINFNWIRQIKVVLSGLSNAGDRGLEADGSMNKFRISAKIHKFMGLGDPAQVMIWNLSPETRSGFQRQKTKIEIYAKWRDGPKSGDYQKCFVGNLQNAQSYQHDQDTVTTIYALSGLEALAKTTYPDTWKQGTNVNDIVKELANKLAAESDGQVAVDPKNIVGIDAVLGEKGWSTSGSVMNALDRLAKQHGFNWSIDDGQFKATGSIEALQKTTEIRDVSIIDVNPHFATPLQIETGISFRCVFDAGLMPHQLVNINSVISDNQKHNGTYKVHHISHSLDTHASMSFITTGEAFTLSKRS